MSTNTVAIRPSMARIYALESWLAFVQVLRAPAFALPTLLFPLRWSNRWAGWP